MDQPAKPTVVACIVFAGIGFCLFIVSAALKYWPAPDYYLALDGINLAERGLNGEEGGRVLYVSYYAELAEHVEVYLVAEADGDSFRTAGNRRFVGERRKIGQWVGDLILNDGMFSQLPSTLEKHEEVLLVKEDGGMPAEAGSELDLYKFVDESGVDIRVYLRVESVE
jgi:hypothetical protein